jgi:hypothetical protein
LQLSWGGEIESDRIPLKEEKLQQLAQEHKHALQRAGTKREEKGKSSQLQIIPSRS